MAAQVGSQGSSLLCVTWGSRKQGGAALKPQAQLWGRLGTGCSLLPSRGAGCGEGELGGRSAGAQVLAPRGQKAGVGRLAVPGRTLVRAKRQEQVEASSAERRRGCDDVTCLCERCHVKAATPENADLCFWGGFEHGAPPHATGVGCPHAQGPDPLGPGFTGPPRDGWPGNVTAGKWSSA